MIAAGYVRRGDVSNDGLIHANGVGAETLA